MLGRLKFRTGYEKLPLTHISAKSPTLQKYEFLLRVILREPGHALVEKARDACDQFIQEEPLEAFFYYARSYLTPEKAEAKKFLLRAYALSKPEDLTSECTAYDLAELHYQLQEFLAAQCWHTKAVLAGNKKAENEFLGNIEHGELGKFASPQLTEGFVRKYNDKFNSGVVFVQQKTLSACEFFIVILSRSNPNTFQGFVNSAWFKRFDKQSVKDFITGFYREGNRNMDFLHEVQNFKSSFYLMIDALVCTNGVMFIDFLVYCQRNSIVDDELFHKLMASVDHYVQHTQSFTILGRRFFSNKVATELYFFYLRTNNFALAKDMYLRVDCEQLKVTHFEGLPKEVSEYWRYQVFSRLVCMNKTAEATIFLNSITNLQLFDGLVFDYFKKVDPEEKSVQYYKLQRDTLESIVAEAEKGVIFQVEFMQRVCVEKEIASHTVTKIRYLFIETLEKYFNYIDDRERNKGTAATYLGHGEKARRQLLVEANGLLNSDILKVDFVARPANVPQQFKDFAKELGKFIEKCKKEISGDHTATMLAEMEQKYSVLAKSVAGMTQAHVDDLVHLRNMRPVSANQPAPTFVTQPEDPQYYFVPVDAALPPGAQVVPVHEAPPSYEQAIAEGIKEHSSYATPGTVLFTPAHPLQQMLALAQYGTKPSGP